MRELAEHRSTHCGVEEWYLTRLITSGRLFDSSPRNIFRSRKMLRGSPRGGPQHNKTMYVVYLLISKKDGRTYVGYTKNIDRRLKEHNIGQVTATKHRRPFSVFFTEEYDTEKEAKAREAWWKSSSGRKKLKEFFTDNSEKELTANERANFHPTNTEIRGKPPHKDQ